MSCDNYACRHQICKLLSPCYLHITSLPAKFDRCGRLVRPKRGNIAEDDSPYGLLFRVILSSCYCILADSGGRLLLPHPLLIRHPSVVFEYSFTYIFVICEPGTQARSKPSSNIDRRHQDHVVLQITLQPMLPAPANLNYPQTSMVVSYHVSHLLMTSLCCSQIPQRSSRHFNNLLIARHCRNLILLVLEKKRCLLSRMRVTPTTPSLSTLLIPLKFETLGCHTTGFLHSRTRKLSRIILFSILWMIQTPSSTTQLTGL